MLLLSSSPSASLPPIFPPAAVSLLINFSLLTRAQSCSSPQPASETALRSALATASQPQRLISARTVFGFKSVLKVGLFAVTLPWGTDLRLDQFHLLKSLLGYLVCQSIRLYGGQMICTLVVRQSQMASAQIHFIFYSLKCKEVCDFYKLPLPSGCLFQCSPKEMKQP